MPATHILEKDVLKVCIDWLGYLPHTLVFRRNVGALKKGKHYIRFSKVGASDLWGVTYGFHFEVEIKRPGNVPSEDQNLWLDNMRAVGAIAIWADSLTMLMEKFRIEYDQRGLKWK